MSQSQSIVPPLESPSQESSALPIEPVVGSWEPYLDLMKSWQRADEISAKAIERAESTRQQEENRARSGFEADTAKLETTRKERVNTIETERKAARESADRLLAQAQAIQARVRQGMESVGLETLMDDIEVSPSPVRGDSTTTLASLRDTVASSIAIEESLQADLFDLRAARQRQSAQLWAVGIGLWMVAVVVFAPYSWISALLVALAAFIMATPRKVGMREALRPSFAAHISHCIALLIGEQQVMQYPFSLTEKGRTISGNALGGSVATAFVAWLLFLMIGSPLSYAPFEMVKHLALISALSIFAGAVTFAIANHDVTPIELSEGDKNKILK